MCIEIRISGYRWGEQSIAVASRISHRVRMLARQVGIRRKGSIDGEAGPISQLMLRMEAAYRIHVLKINASGGIAMVSCRITSKIGI